MDISVAVAVAVAHHDGVGERPDVTIEWLHDVSPADWLAPGFILDFVPIGKR
ncbi:MAG: hypothetical protein M3083_18015 [Actinomycetota bacterium]|nr:hypothetical protein [Actinomycetota bacterium]